MKKANKTMMFIFSFLNYLTFKAKNYMEDKVDLDKNLSQIMMLTEESNYKKLTIEQKYYLRNAFNELFDKNMEIEKKKIEESLKIIQNNGVVELDFLEKELTNKEKQTLDISPEMYEVEFEIVK